MIQLDPVLVVGHAAEAQIDRLATGAMAGARLSNGADVVGQVTFLARAGDPATRTFRVELTVPNPDLAIREGRLVFDIATEAGEKAAEFHLSLGPFRQVVKDYFQICESYFEAVKKLPPSQIEAIDMARRGIHNEGASILRDRLDGKAAVDTDTARRLFTLICVLHWG